MIRFTTMTLLRITAVVAGWALLLRAIRNGSAQSRFIAAAVYAGIMLMFLYGHYRREAKKAMVPEDGRPEKQSH
jgi:hypothetical protein